MSEVFLNERNTPNIIPVPVKRAIDLTHSISSESPSWDGGCCFSLSVAVDYEDCSGQDLFRVQQITTRAGIGTHIDAPAHCFKGKATVDRLELESLVTNCVVIKVNGEVDAAYNIMPSDIEQFERAHGHISPNSFVIFHTGWSQYWSTPEKYRNDLNFPSVHERTAELLLERKIAGLGIDTLSPDAGGQSFPVHRLILGEGKYLVENVADASSLPPTGARVFIMPMKIQGGTEAPVRLVAFV
jgi:kynurenine formamidase